MNKLKEHLLDENKFTVNKINWFLNGLIILSTIFYHQVMTYVFYLLMSFVMLKLMLKDKYVRESKFCYFYLIVGIIIAIKIIYKLLYDFVI